jgi:hypothetical protein
MRRHRIAGAIATGTAGLALTGAAFGSGASGTEHFTFMTTATARGSDTFSVIATGVFTAGGTATLPSGKGTLRFPTGTIETTSKSSKPINTSNMKTCYGTLSQKGTYTIVGGTGAYKGISGSGKLTVSLREVIPIVNGKCHGLTPVAAQGIVTGSGPVTLG